MEKGSYSLEELAKFFGISIASVREWIKNGRFLGVEESGNIIAKNTVWQDSRGNYISVKSIEEEYKLQKKKDEKFTDEEETKALLNMIMHFENKYDGVFEETLKIKKNKTYQELRDSDEWKYLLERVGRAEKW